MFANLSVKPPSGPVARLPPHKTGFAGTPMVRFRLSFDLHRSRLYYDKIVLESYKTNMPTEIPGSTPPEQPPDDWRQLGQEAAQDWPLDHPGVGALYENHVVPQLKARGLGHLAVSKEDKAAGRFLHKHESVNKGEVDTVAAHLRSRGAKFDDNAGTRTALYLDFMSDRVNDGILTGDPESLERQVEARVIAPEDVPEAYFDLQRRIAREQGRGDMHITPGRRSHEVETLRADQRNSLEKWADYLPRKDVGYPNWFKQYVWESVGKLGLYDKTKHEFQGRTKSTVAPYPDLNREALGYVCDVLTKTYIKGEAVEGGEKLSELLKKANFGDLYAHAVLECTPASQELMKNTQGTWTKYDQIEGDYDPDYEQGEDGEFYDNHAGDVEDETALRLARSLQGHGTGWCTAGETTAAKQLTQGDFYVYYTKDEEDKDTVPRIAIRMEYGQVVEVRGIGPEQSLEDSMNDIVAEKLRVLPGSEDFLDIVRDMKHLTAIDKVMKEDSSAELSPEDLRFLYEIDHKIIGLEYGPDPRVKDLQGMRSDIFADCMKATETTTHKELADAFMDSASPDFIPNNFERFPAGSIDFIKLAKAVRGKGLSGVRSSSGLFSQLDDVESGFFREHIDDVLASTDPIELVEALKDHPGFYYLWEKENEKFIAASHDHFALAKAFAATKVGKSIIFPHVLDTMNLSDDQKKEILSGPRGVSQ